MRRLVWLTLIAALAGGAYYYWQEQAHAPAGPLWRTATVDRGPLVRSINASGPVRPVVLVKVGTRISGNIAKLNADFNQAVKQGEILAELDTALIRAALAQIEAEIAAARAERALAKTQHARNVRLVGEGFISASVLDESAAALAARSAQVDQLEARKRQEMTNLDHAIIRAPIDGVVVARDVDLGQTVAASFQTPTLFQIAGDLAHMQIETRVAEADVGELKIGQRASFTVDAYPNARRSALVRQIRLNPTIEQNVVTYNVVLDTDNADGLLLPGMTAQVSIELARRDDVLRVPNAALRFRPPAAKGADTGETKPRAKGPTVYRTDGKTLEAVSVQLGATNDTHTELISGPLAAGDAIVTGERIGGKAEGGGNFRLRLH
ncbi:MAG TPA: efflux RND transporter periplasmic adaptor subunit [Denitromonas sp.]|uniref:efflux RND transporter periplasmic adaptor subunit n=1 Tax=Denitromonas sp. TaxID=2734609 RepID=UPI001DBE2E46|nr:efflux RND transporter periplasmic adaptor subunit [Rhodocyclaceae bacterium]HPR06201.1 efflux RND transporter periplasmic adaptor subunit [Denitromonas sp.]